MKIIEPKVELWKQNYDLTGIWKHIAKCARVCYQAEPRSNQETDEEFVQRVIFRNRDYRSLDTRDKQLQLHLSVLEHGTVYLKVPNKHFYKIDMVTFDKNPYSRISYNIEEEVYYVETNMRVLVEKGLMRYFIKYHTEPTFEDRLTFSITTDIGTARELDRHRSHSISEESTRFCNYAKDKFDNELTFIKPNWNLDSFAGELFKKSCQTAEERYMSLIDNGWTAQKAREVLPLCTKVQTIHTAYLSDWQEFLKLRSDNVSGSVHPNMMVVANQIKEILMGKN